MKYRLVRDDIEPSYPGKPFGWVPDDMKDFVQTREVFESGRTQKKTYWRSDVVFEGPWGPFLVQHGMAEPADEECEIACYRTPAERLAAQRAYERTKRGIHPDDFEAFDKGYMLGYQPDGSWLPGPKYDEYMALKAKEESEEEDEI